MHQRFTPSFLRTSNGVEVDLILTRGGETHFFECKLSKAPKVSRGFFELYEALKPKSAWVVAPVDEQYELKKGIVVSPSSAINLE